METIIFNGLVPHALEPVWYSGVSVKIVSNSHLSLATQGGGSGKNSPRTSHVPQDPIGVVISQKNLDNTEHQQPIWVVI